MQPLVFIKGDALFRLSDPVGVNRLTQVARGQRRSGLRQCRGGGQQPVLIVPVAVEPKQKPVACNAGLAERAVSIGQNRIGVRVRVLGEFSEQVPQRVAELADIADLQPAPADQDFGVIGEQGVRTAIGSVGGQELILLMVGQCPQCPVTR